MEIKLYNDIAFKWIFGRQEHTGPLIRFINSVLCHEGDPPKFSEVQILNPYDSSEPYKNEKQGILDIRAKEIHTNEWIDLEVQVAYSESYPQRSKYYLAGLYRDQLEKSKEMNYDELTPIYGIHVLVETLFRNKADEAFWFNHYTMLNTRSHKPLIGHWHLFYLELKKFLKCFNKARPENELEEWSYFLGTIQDNAKPLDTNVSDNEGIKEVYEMLQTFTQNDRLREQYRLQEEYIRAQRTEQVRIIRLQERFHKEKQAKIAALKAQERALKFQKAALKAQKKEKLEKEAAMKAQEAALKAQKKEKLEKEAAMKAQEAALKAQKKGKLEKEAAMKAQEAALQEVEKIKRTSIQHMKQQGQTKEDISQLLNLPLTDVECYF